MKTSKRLITRESGHVSMYDLEGTIDSVIEYLTKLKNTSKQYDAINIVLGWDYEGERQFSVHYCTEETDEEYNERIQKEQKAKIHQEETEIALLRKLKKKYGDI